MNSENGYSHGSLSRELLAVLQQGGGSSSPGDEEVWLCFCGVEATAGGEMQGTRVQENSVGKEVESSFISLCQGPSNHTSHTIKNALISQFYERQW